MITWTFLVITWVVLILTWRRHNATAKLYTRVHHPPLHKVYDLVAINDETVTVICADCWQPLGTATITAWGELAEQHWREANKRG